MYLLICMEFASFVVAALMIININVMQRIEEVCINYSQCSKLFRYPHQKAYIITLRSIVKRRAVLMWSSVASRRVEMGAEMSW